MIEIVPFARSYDRKQFACGNADLDRWLKEQAGQQERINNTRTFLAVDDGRVVGYYATTTYRLELDEAARAFGVTRRRYPVPAVLIARLAVDRAYQGSGLGIRLLTHALRAIGVASHGVGFEVVVAHAIDAQAVTFYARAGFIRFEDESLGLFIRVDRLRATL